MALLERRPALLSQVDLYVGKTVVKRGIANEVGVRRRSHLQPHL
jgi:hypothetical protein